MLRDYFALKAWYPAAGYRNVFTGALTSVGNLGFSWASTVSGIDALDLYFGQGYLIPGGASRRGYGFQVRCLRE